MPQIIDIATLAALRFRDPQGHPLPVSLRIVRPLKGDHDVEKQAYLVDDGRRALLLKFRPHRRWRQRLRASRGRSSLCREAANMELVRASGFAVPALAAFGVQSRFGLVVAEALLVEWLDQQTTLIQRIRAEREQGNPGFYTVATQAAALLLARARQAGLADKDFGLHNLMNPVAAAGVENLRWTDLERVFRAPPDDPEGTTASAGSLLSSCWLASGCSEPDYLQARALIWEILPAPRAGWTPLLAGIDRYVQGKLKLHLQYQFISRVPEPLRA